MSFPSSPTIGQRHTADGRVWEWSNGIWRHIGNPPAPAPFASLDARYDRLANPEPSFVPRAGTSLWARVPLGGVATNAPTVNEERCVPFVSPVSGVIDRLAVEVTTVNASSTFRLGVRANDNGLPGTLVYGTAEPLLGSGTNGVREDTVSIPVEANVMYWLSFVQYGTAATFRASSDMGPFLTAVHGLASTNIAAYTQTGVTGALPATFTLAGTAVSMPRFAVRFTEVTV
jgi:hypothetical protein